MHHPIGSSDRFQGRLRLAVLLAAPWLASCGSSSPVQVPPVPTPAPTPTPGITPAAELKASIAALFAGTGPLIPTEGTSGCDYPGFWSGFPRGTHVTLRVSTTVSRAAQDALRAGAEDVAVATLGAVTASFELVEDPDPRPQLHEITATVVRDPVAEGCRTGVGCTFPSFLQPGVLAAARVVMPSNQTPNAFVHDAIGHGAMGMCHIDGNLIGGPSHSLMSYGPGVYSDLIALRLTARDIEAAQAIYRSGLDPGASRSALVEAGLIDPSAQAVTPLATAPRAIEAVPPPH